MAARDLRWLLVGSLMSLGFGLAPPLPTISRTRRRSAPPATARTASPIDKSIPVICGQNEGYIYIELRDMKKGARKNDQMAPIVENLSRDDMLALAAYFSAKPWTNLKQPRASEERRQSISPRWPIPPAASGCHQAGYIGAGTQPRLAGQSQRLSRSRPCSISAPARAPTMPG